MNMKLYSETMELHDDLSYMEKYEEAQEVYHTDRLEYFSIQKRLRNSNLGELHPSSTRSIRKVVVAQTLNKK